MWSLAFELSIVVMMISAVTLAVLFWTTQSSNSLADVKRVYVVAKRNLALKEMLDAFGEGNARALKQWLRDDPTITCCDDSFSNYQELYRKLLYMDNKNAPVLLSRALGLKKIDDLTRLIRELVLEPSSVKDDAKKVVAEFADLVAIHGQLVDARAQKEHLSKLPELNATIKKATDRINKLADEKNCLPVYVGEISVQLWNEKISGIKGELTELGRQIKQAEVQKADTTKLVERRHEEYLQFGGDKIVSLQKEIDHSRQQLKRVIRDSSQYQEDARALALEPQLEEGVFNHNQMEAADKLADTESVNKKYQDRFAGISGKYSQLQANIYDISKQIQEIEARPDSNIGIKFQQLRDELVSSLQLRKDQCVFIGELIDVNEQDKKWQGAIERAMGGLPTTLAVPHDCYSMVTRWLNVRHTGLHVRVQVVGNSPMSREQKPRFKDNGYLRKLLWRDHPYKEWLKHHLQRFDLQCVATSEELDRTPFSLTQQGLMHMNRGRFEKKDLHRIDDRRRWSLGFSNKSRLAILNNDKKDFNKDLIDTEKQVSVARRELDSITDKKLLWQKMLAYHWGDIDAPYWQKKHADLESDLKELAKSGGTLDKAKSRWELAKSQLAKVETKLRNLASTEGSLKNSLNIADFSRNKAQQAAAKGLPPATRELLAARFGVLAKDDLGQMSDLTLKVEKELDRLLDMSRNKKNSAEKSAIGIMSSFRSNEKWHVQWSTRIFRDLAEQLIPAFIVIHSIKDLIGFLGNEAVSRSKIWERNMTPLLQIDNSLYPALVKHLETIEKLCSAEVELLARLIPQLKPGMGEGLYQRALPLVGIDTKFLESHQALVEELIDTIHHGAISKAGGLRSWLHCKTPPKDWLTIRPLCPATTNKLGGIPVLKMDSNSLREYELPALNILVVENMQSGWALPEMKDTIAVIGGGKNIAWMDAPWLKDKRLGYWGDIDTWGLAILSDVRDKGVTVQALMMDFETVANHEQRMVNEPKPVKSCPASLTENEITLFYDLISGRFRSSRLEQERLSADYIRNKLMAWLSEVNCDSFGKLL